MKKIVLTTLLIVGLHSVFAQTNPVILNWLQNTTGIMGRHYVRNNYIPINDNTLANVLSVKYSTANVYVATNGIPSYITGPFLDGNPSIATSQNAIFKLPLNPVKNTGNPVNTTPNNIGLFINTEYIAVVIAIPADGPSFGVAHSGQCI